LELGIVAKSLFEDANELVEASQHHGLRRVLARWMRYDVVALDEVGYVPLAEVGAEFLYIGGQSVQSDAAISLVHGRAPLRDKLALAHRPSSQS
jgi:hypothetical protein